MGAWFEEDGGIAELPVGEFSWGVAGVEGCAYRSVTCEPDHFFDTECWAGIKRRIYRDIWVLCEAKSTWTALRVQKVRSPSSTNRGKS